MKVYVDVSCQVTQCYKRRNKKLFPGTVMGFVDKDKTTKYSTFLSRNEIKYLIDFYSPSNITNLECKIHCCLIFLCLEPFINQIKEAIICPDFPKAKLSRELFYLFPKLKNIKIRFGRDGRRRSPADNYVNHVHKNPKEANRTLNKQEIIDKISKGLHKGKIS